MGFASLSGLRVGTLPNPARDGDETCVQHGFHAVANQTACLRFAEELGLLVYAVAETVAQYVPSGCLRMEPGVPGDRIYWNAPHDPSTVDHARYNGDIFLVCDCWSPASDDGGYDTAVFVGIGVGAGVLVLGACVAWWFWRGRLRDYDAV